MEIEGMKKAPLEKGFVVECGDDPEHEDLVAEIRYDGKFCCLVSQEEGFDKLHIEIYPRKDGKQWDFDFRELQRILQLAADELWRLRKI